MEVCGGVDTEGGGFNRRDADAEAVFEGAKLFEGFPFFEGGWGEFDEAVQGSAGEGVDADVVPDWARAVGDGIAAEV